MGYPLKKILASLPPGPRPPHFHRRGGAPALNSPDLNPTDYFVWSVFGSKANEHRVASRDTPKHQITEVTDSIDKEGVARAWACFRTRIKKVLDAKGDHI